MTQQVSLTWTHIYVPDNHDNNNNNNNTTTPSNNSTISTPMKLYGEFVSSQAMLPHSSYLIKVSECPLPSTDCIDYPFLTSMDYQSLVCESNLF